MIVRELITKLKLAVDASGFQIFDAQLNHSLSRLDEFGAGTKRFLKGMGEVGMKLTGAFTLPIVGMGTWSVITASKLEQLQVAFGSMMGDVEQGKKMVEDLVAFAERTPFETMEVAPLAKQLFAMGVESEKIIPTLTSLGNVAAGLGVPLERLAYNFGQVKAQTKLTGPDLRDFARAGVPIIAELAKMLGVSEAAVKDMVSAGSISFKMVEDAFISMSSEGGRFANMMEAQSKTIAGRWAYLTEKFWSTRVEIGKMLVEELKLDKAFIKLGDIISKLTKWIHNLNKPMKIFILILSGVLLSLGPILIAVSSIGTMMMSLVGMLLLLKSGFLGVTIASMGLNASMLLIPALVLLAIAALSLLINDIYTWVKGGKSLTGILLGPWEDWSRDLMTLLNGMGKFIDDFFLALFTGNWANVKSNLDLLYKTVKIFVSDVLAELSKLLHIELFGGGGSGKGKEPGYFSNRGQAIFGAPVPGENVAVSKERNWEKIKGYFSNKGEGLDNINNNKSPSIFNLNTSIALQNINGKPTQMGEEAANEFLGSFNRQLRNALRVE